MKRHIALYLLLALATFVVGGCGQKVKKDISSGPNYNKPLLPGEQALVKITDPAGIPDFTLASINRKDLAQAVTNSLHYLQKASSKQFFPSCGITHRRNLDSLTAFAQLLDSNLSPSALNSAILAKFDIYMSVGCDHRGTVLFTGYYTPIFDGSLTSDAKFRYPLYSQPADLVKTSTGQIRGRRSSSGQLVPYPARAIIAATNMLIGNELLYLGDAFEAYIAQVQGSAIIQLPDGQTMTIGYAANNGHDYRGISSAMIDDGRITSSQLSLSSMIAFFKQNPDLVSHYTNKNPRYVFFRQDDSGIRGSLNEPVLAMRSIATDKSIFPRGSLTFISTSLPKFTPSGILNQVYSGFALDQDTGGAIRAPGRCDVYMGTGEAAGRLAGSTYQEGKLYYLFLKTDIDLDNF